MADDISLVVGVDYTELTGLIKTANQTKRVLSGVAKDFANTGSQKQYMASINKLVAAQKRLPEASRLSRSEIMKLGAQMQQEVKFTNALTAATSRLSEQQKRASATARTLANNQMAATKASNRLGVVTQQAGYQVSDFVVQVQSGTNPLIAFSQQASQLVGVLPLVASQLGMTTRAAIALSAGLGIVIPVVSAAAMVLLNMRKSAEDTKKQVDEYKKTIDSLSSAVTNLTNVMELNNGSVDNAITKYGRLTKDVKDFLAATKELAEYEVVEETTNAFEKLINTKDFVKVVGELGGLKETLEEERAKLAEEIAGGQEEDILDNLREEIKKTEDAYNSLSATLDQMPEGKLMSLADEFLNAASIRNIDGMVDAISGIREVVNELPADVRLNMLKMVVQMEAQLRRLQGSAEKTADEIRNESFEFSVKLDILTEDAIFDLDAVLEEMRDRDFNFETELDILAKEAIDDLDAVLEEMRKRDLTVDIELRLLTEQAIADLQAVLDQQKQDQFLQGQDILSLGETAIADLAKVLEEQRKKAEEERKKAAEKAERDPLNVLRKQLELEDALQGQTEARRRVIQALGVDYMKYGASTIKSLEDQINATIELRKENERFAEEVEGPLTDAFGDVADAFGEFIANGLKDFKDFTKSIVASFKQMLAQMISAALRNRIFIPIATGMSAGFGSSAAASTMSSYASGGGGSFLGSIAGTLAGGASAFGSGLMAGIQGFAGGFAGGGGLMGGLSGYGATLSATAANAGIMGTIGAAVPAIAAVALVIGAFSSKTKELDSGLKATIKTNDVLIESYRKMQKSSFFGLSKKKYTITDAVEGSPVEQQILQLQHGIMSMAKAIGVADDVFNDFLYNFDISLKGLTEDEKLKKINEELGKMGNAFAALIPNVEGLDQLNAIMNERANLEIRLLQAQGDTAALREIELAGTNEYNRALLRQVFAAEDARDAIDDVTNSLQENSFATKLQFERAKAYRRLGLDAPANTNSVPMSTPAAPVMSVQRDPSIEQLRREMRSMHEETMVAYSKLIKNTKDNKNILRGWDIVGLPAERSA